MPSFRQARKSSSKSSAPIESNQSLSDVDVNATVRRFYQLNSSIVKDRMDCFDLYVNPIRMLFSTFVNGHRNMLQFIRDIYRMPNVEQNGQYLTSVLGLVVFGSNAETYSKIFVESDFYLYCAFVGEMKRRCVGFEDIRNYNQLMNDAKKEVGIATFNAMMAIF